MFSTKKRPPAPGKATTIVTTTTTTRPGDKPITTTKTVVQVRRVAAPVPVPVPAAPRPPRPQPPITTIKKVVAPPPPSPKPKPTAPVKRKAEPVPKKLAPPAKAKKVVKKAVFKKPQESSSEEESSRSEEEEEAGAESDSSEDGLPLFSKRESSLCVERDAAATLDGNVECITGHSLVMDTRDAYEQYFVDLTAPEKPASEWAGSEVPSIELEYPGKGGKEKFALLAPRNHDEYDPIEDVMDTIRKVLDEFLTPAQSLAMFAHSPASNAFASFLSANNSRSGTPSTPTDSNTPAAAPLVPLMRALEKAKAKKDGPAFLAELERYNIGIRSLRDEGKMEENIKAMKGVPQKVWEKVTAQAYDRTVGPEIEDLAKYEAFSDNVYGELLPKFMGEIFQKTQVGPNSVFVDLGSGVGNCVVQAALATGCEAWGFENMAHASSLARNQLVEAEKRFRLWGLNSGKMSVVEADFCEHPHVGEVLRRADVILVNNEVFTSSLNERLSLLFLDLRDDVKIVSLKAFASSFTLSAHNRHSPLAILKQGPELRYPRNSVSWKSESGTYFIGKVDRGLLQKFDEREAKRAAKRLAQGK